MVAAAAVLVLTLAAFQQPPAVGLHHVAALLPAGVVGPVNPVAPALGFGVMTEGNANVLTNENEGTMAVGGDLTFGSYQLANNTAGSFIVPGDAQPTALVVGGRVNFAGSVAGSRLQVLSNGYAKIGDLTGTFVRDLDNNSAQVNTRILPADDYDASPRVELVTRQPVASVGPASPINFPAAFAAFRSTSTNLATCDNTVVLRTPNGDVLPRPIPPGSNAVISLTPGVTNVLNLSAADLSNIAVLTFATAPTAITPLLINVDTGGIGDSYAWTVPNFAGISGNDARYVLLNFPTVTTLTLTPGAATIEGSIYAPDADLVDHSASNTEGSIITRTFDHQGGEVHYFPFSTTLACGNPSAASLSVVKSSSTTAITTVGQQVPYAYQVVNTGGVSLTDVNVTDVQTPPSSGANLGPIVCVATVLAPGESTTCSATYTVTQADLDNESLVDTAVAHGTPETGPVVDSAPDSLTIPAARLIPAISVMKQSTTTAITVVGQVVPYSYVVVNNGSLTLTGVNVTDVQAPPSSNVDLTTIVCPVTTLAPRASTTCTATYTVTQADLDNGSLADTATAHGTPPRGPAVDSAPDTLTIPAAGLVADISVVKSSTATTINSVGQVVPYAFLVVDTGSLSLSTVNVTDVLAPPSSHANLSPIVCPVTTLAPGASTTCSATYTVTQADLDNGSVVDTATAHGTPPGGSPVDSPPDPFTIPTSGLVSDVSVVKSSSTVAVTTVGQLVPYSYLVVNTGTTSLTDVNVTDGQTPPSSNVDLSPIVCPVTTLAPGASTTCTATYTVTQADLDNESLVDTATAHGTPPTGPAVDSPPDPLTIPAAALIADISIVKSSTTAAITAVGQSVPYSFLVTNSGAVTLTGVNVTDVQAPPSSNVDLAPIVCVATVLAPGASTTCTATYTVTQADLDHDSLADSATAHGTPTSGPVVDSRPASLIIPAANLIAQLSIVKASTTTVITAVGQTVPYSFVVVNTGGLTLTGVTVNDTLMTPARLLDLSPITCGPADTPNGAVTLAPGTPITCSASYTVTQTDFDNLNLIDVATATGTPPFGPPPVSPQSPVTIPVAHPAVAIEKSARPTTVDRAGQIVTFTFVISNAGNTTLADVGVEETAFSGTGILGPVVCGEPPTASGQVFLAIGTNTTCRASYKVTQSDVDSGVITNAAVAVGTPPTIPDQPPPEPVRSDPSTAEVAAPARAALTVVKTSTTTVITAPGQSVPYSYLVTNAGNVTLTAVTLADSPVPPADPTGLGPVTCGPDDAANGSITLTPGASVTCRAVYTVSAADYRHGSVRNTATATGHPPTGPAPLSPPSQLTIAIQPGGLPVTGFALIQWITVGFASLVLGVMLVAVARRRQRGTTLARSANAPLVRRPW